MRAEADRVRYSGKWGVLDRHLDSASEACLSEHEAELGALVEPSCCRPSRRCRCLSAPLEAQVEKSLIAVRSCRSLPCRLAWMTPARPSPSAQRSAHGQVIAPDVNVARQRGLLVSSIASHYAYIRRERPGHAVIRRSLLLAKHRRVISQRSRRAGRICEGKFSRFARARASGAGAAESTALCLPNLWR